jgi:hypothetical protein
MTQPNTSKKAFSVELKTELPYVLIVWPALFLLCVITRPSILSAWPLMVIFIVSLLIYAILTYRLTSIEVDKVKGVVVLVETNLLKKSRSKSYPLKDLVFTYKIGKPGLRHRVVNICKLYLKDKQLAEIIPDHDGWTDDTVNDLAKGLVDLEIPKKFIGYSIKDAEINGL